MSNESLPESGRKERMQRKPLSEGKGKMREPARLSTGSREEKRSNLSFPRGVANA